MPEESKYYPPLGFHFRVVISDLGGEDMDSRFQSVGGLSVEMETETRKEGGENRFEHTLPVRSKYSTLTLKRGLVVSSALLKWCSDTFSALNTNVDASNKDKPLIQPKDVMVSLLNEKHEPLMSWNIIQAYPRKWSMADLNAEQSAIAIESIELQYQYFTLKT
jgi:phage tail-like protein